MSSSDEKLIEYVSQCPELYDVNSPGYKDYNKKNYIWKEISAKLGASVDRCKTRWKNIRDHYRRKKIQAIHTTISSSNSNRKVAPWSLMGQLTFLDNELKNLPLQRTTNENSLPTKTKHSVLTNSSTKSNLKSKQCSTHVKKIEKKAEKEENSKKIPSNDVQTIINTKTLSMLQEKVASEKTAIIQMLGENKSDSIDLFCQSIARSLRNLRPELITEGKLRIIGIIGQLELKNAPLSPQKR